MDRVKRRWWTTSVTVLASLVVLAAVLSGLFQLAVMALPGYRDQLSDYVSRVANRPIDIGGVALVWHRLRPQLELNDIVLYADDGETPALSAESLRIGFGLFRLLGGDTFPNQIALSGLQVVAEIDRDNQVHLRGFDTAGRAKSTHDWRRDLARFDSILLEDCTVTVDDARLVGGTPRFHLVQAEARRRIGGASLEARLELPAFMGETAEFDGRIEGDLEKPEEWEGRWTASVENLARLPWLDARLPGRPRLQFEGADLSLSGTLSQGRVDDARLDVQADAITGRRGGREAHIRDLSFSATAHRNAQSWGVEVPQLKLAGDAGEWPDSRVRLQWSPTGGGSRIEADADFIRLQDVVPWAMLWGDESLARLRNVSGELRGVVARARLAAGAPVTYSLRAGLDDLAYKATDTNPGFAGLKGEISATEAGGRLSVAARPFSLTYARVFAQPLQFDQLEGELAWTHDAEAWRIHMPSFGWQLAGSTGKGDVDLLLPADVERSPEIKLAATFSADDATRLKPFMPVYWNQNLRDWLGRAIVSGRVPKGQLDIAGRLADFPFKDDNGVFKLDIDVANGRLAYAPDWPPAEQVAAQLQFRAGTMTIVADSGRIAGNRVQKLVATIPEFQDAVLTIDGEVEGEAARYYDFLRASPLAPRLSGLLDRTQASGMAAVAVNIRIPLKDAAQTQVSGTVRLRGAELLYSGLDEPFKNIEGELAFTGEGVSSQGTRGTFYDVPVTAALTPEGRGATRLTADLDYELQADGSALSRYVPGLLRPWLQGAAHFRAEILLGGASDGLSVTSDLRGIAVNLPAPAGKTADESFALRVRIGGGTSVAAAPVPSEPALAGAVDPSGPGPAVVTPVAQAPASPPLKIGVSYAQRLGADVLLDHGADGELQAQRVLVRLGSGDIPSATETGVHVTGQTEEVDVSEWIKVVQGRARAPAASRAVSSDAESAFGLQSIDLQTARLNLLGYRADGVRFLFQPLAGGWSVKLSGQDAEGTLDWETAPAPALATLHGRLKKLRTVPRSIEPADAVPKPKAGDPLDPNELPVLDLDIENLQLGKAQLGHVLLATQRIDGGQSLLRAEAGGGDLDLKASGDWLRRAGASTAQITFKADSRSIGPLLEGFGYAPNLSAEKSQFEGNVSWPLAVDGIDWTMGQGKLDLDIERGQLRAVEPGAGRVLGLINFYALPRRLTLDFSDVTSKGLGFDRVHGSFAAGNGNATTDDLMIESPSLKIELRGRVGLAARDYDQKIKVYPDVSGGVTLGALLLGGPALGAIALVAQEVLDKPLEQVTQLTYKVTGNWDNPQVKRAD